MAVCCGSPSTGIIRSTAVGPLSSAENYIIEKEGLCGRVRFWRRGMRTSKQTKPRRRHVLKCFCSRMHTYRNTRHEF